MPTVAGHPDMPHAPVHNTIHTGTYHRNVYFILRETASIPGATKSDIEKALREIALSLQSGTFPIYERLERS